MSDDPLMLYQGAYLSICLLVFSRLWTIYFERITAFSNFVKCDLNLIQEKYLANSFYFLWPKIKKICFMETYYLYIIGIINHDKLWSNCYDKSARIAIMSLFILNCQIAIQCSYIFMRYKSISCRSIIAIRSPMFDTRLGMPNIKQ